MNRRVFFISIALFSLIIANAQTKTISGTVTDQQTQSPLASATINLSSLSDTASKQNTLTDSAGNFSFTGLSRDSFLISVSYVGYSAVSRIIAIDTSDIHLNIVVAPGASTDMATVIIQTTISPVSQKGDTLQINASQFKVNPDASGEDLVKKVPGITVENGQVKAQGENVQRVTLDGRELFGDDATAALRNLPAEIIDKIQIFDRLSDQAQFTGFDDGNTTKAINIITKVNMRNGQYGRVFTGYGTDDRYQAGGNATILKNNRKISLVGNFNNVNQQNFSQQDLLGVTNNAQGGGGPRGGGGGNRGGGGFGNSGNFLVGQQNGINKTNAAGINYSDIWGKKLTVTGSYFFNNTGNATSQISNQQYFTGTVFNQNTKSTSASNNNRVNMRVEWKIDSFNQIIFTPNLSFQNNNSNKNLTTTSFSNVKQLSTTINNTDAKRLGNNLNNNILYRHSFKKRGRTLSVNFNTSSNKTNGDVYTISTNTRFDSLNNAIYSISNRFTGQANNSYSLSANLAYTEPLGKKSQLQLNYTPSYSNNKANQQTFLFNNTEGKYSLFDTSLSNRFDNTTKTQNTGVTYRYGDRDNQIAVGASYQFNTLTSNQDFPRAVNVNKSFQNILPNALVRLKLSARSNIRLFYRSSTNNPSVTQLSDVVNIINRPYITAGNPDLKQQYMHVINGRYTFTNTGKGLLFMGNIFYQAANDYITNATVINSDTASKVVNVFTNAITLRPGEQLSYPINLNGYRNIRSFVTLAFPLKFIKSNLNMNGGISFSRQPGSINNAINVSKNTTYSSGIVIASNVSQYVDFTLSYTANFNTVKNALQKQLNSNYFQHVAGIQLNLLSKNGWFFQNDLNNQLYKGLAQGFNQIYTLWNMAAGKKFLKNKKGELKLSVFDLLKQNQSIIRNITATYYEDVQNKVLRQYFMLTFTYTLRNFGTVAARNFNPGNTNFGHSNMRF